MMRQSKQLVIHYRDGEVETYTDAQWEFHTFCMLEVVQAGGSFFVHTDLIDWMDVGVPEIA